MFRERMTPQVRECCDCKCNFRPNHVIQMRCLHCSASGAYAQIRNAAHAAVYKAVRKGLIPSLKIHDIACVDCGNSATDYDHRNYDKPLEVEPVCRACNLRRGPATYTLPDVFAPPPGKAEAA